MQIEKGIQGSCPYMRIANQGTSVESAKEYLAARGLKPYPRLGIRHGVPSEREAQLAEDRRLGVILIPLPWHEAIPGRVYRLTLLESLFVWWTAILARLIGFVFRPLTSQFSRD